jgi:aspartate/methionine/tyrosine aminotransferase
VSFNFETYPFEKLRALVADIAPNPDYSPVSLTIGEPKFDTPQFILDKVTKELNGFRYYPKSAGEPELKSAMLDFVKRRFHTSLNAGELLPVTGTREVLFNFPQFLLFSIKNPVMAFTNPFYQIYEGAAIASRAKIVHLDLLEENSFLPKKESEVLKDCDLVILNFPNNPTGANMLLDELVEWVKLAQEYDFVLLNDECYSEIYTDIPPVSLLEAAIVAGVEDFHNILVINSLSKRSSAPGLRSGFIAGDEVILKEYLQYRTYVGAASGLPIQKAAAVAWMDDTHVEKFRKKYCENIELARSILNYPTIEATFYVWIRVDDDLKSARVLLERYNIAVLPGSFLGRDGVGSGYIRIALVEEPSVMRAALENIATYLKDMKR